jgi:hypothetical protein
MQPPEDPGLSFGFFMAAATCAACASCIPMSSFSFVKSRGASPTCNNKQVRLLAVPQLFLQQLILLSIQVAADIICFKLCSPRHSCIGSICCCAANDISQASSQSAFSQFSAASHKNWQPVQLCCQSVSAAHQISCIQPCSSVWSAQ